MAASSWYLGALLAFGLADVVALDLVVGPRALGDRTPVAPPPVMLAAAEPAPAPRVAIASAEPPAPAPDPAPAPAAPAVEARPAPAPAAAPAPIVVEEPPVVIHFATDRATIDARAAAQLDQLAARLVADARTHVVITGHADERGSDRYNDVLSARRMRHVRDYLGERGVAASRMNGRWAGEHEPVAPGDDEAALAANRRVEIRPEGRHR